MVSDLLVPRAQLINARANRVPWYDIVRALQSLQASRAHDERGLPWIAYAGEVSGYTAVALREMIRTYNACTEISEKSKVPLDRIIMLIPMYALEMLTRIWNIDPKIAHSILLNYEKRKISIEEMKTVYNDVKNNSNNRASNAIIGKKAAIDFEVLCYSSILKTDNFIRVQLYEDDRNDKYKKLCKIVKWMRRSKRFSPSFALVENMSASSSVIDAIDCALLQGWSEDRIVQRLIYIDFVSKSFHRFWLLVPSWSQIEDARRLITELEITGFGLVSVNPDTLEMKSLIPAPINKSIIRESLIEPDLIKSLCNQFGDVIDRIVPSHEEIDGDIVNFIP